VTRPYYQSAYVFVIREAQWPTLADMPVSRPIAATMGTSADLRLAQYLMSLQAGARWPRFPMSNDRAALDAVLSGEAGAALVWEPGLWALRGGDAKLSGLRTMAPRPMPETTITVGAALLANEAFLRSNVDQAIASLTEDGTIQSILDEFRFPAKAVKP
jgi:polar amino acid transport system substrate-binding protein